MLCRGVHDWPSDCMVPRSCKTSPNHHLSTSVHGVGLRCFCWHAVWFSPNTQPCITAKLWFVALLQTFRPLFKCNFVLCREKWLLFQTHQTCSVFMNLNMWHANWGLLSLRPLVILQFLWSLPSDLWMNLLECPLLGILNVLLYYSLENHGH